MPRAMRCAATRVVGMRPQLWARWHLSPGRFSRSACRGRSCSQMRKHIERTPSELDCITSRLENLASCPQTSDQSIPYCASGQIKANGATLNSTAQPDGGGKTAVSSSVREPNYSSTAEAGLDLLPFALSQICAPPPQKGGPQQSTHENNKG